eukprot:TRINITY_DN9017_c0_g1_i1.p1 TRINITY_DN9017_c0_g1~~TRINITY_DN9017_c0_g1_i1.p1  ORF type:complete len:228 (+),score=52.15 TRINITY_DN9017_c0_g1_i1:96-779(+)
MDLSAESGKAERFAKAPASMLLGRISPDGSLSPKKRRLPDAEKPVAADSAWEGDIFEDDEVSELQLLQLPPLPSARGTPCVPQESMVFPPHGDFFTSSGLEAFRPVRDLTTVPAVPLSVLMMARLRKNPHREFTKESDVVTSSISMESYDGPSILSEDTLLAGGFSVEEMWVNTLRSNLENAEVEDVTHWEEHFAEAERSMLHTPQRRAVCRILCWEPCKQDTIAGI